VWVGSPESVARGRQLYEMLDCGQCHGDKYRDWRAGIHGKRVGQWDGEKSYFLCVNCHNPHSPGFKGVQEVVADGKKTIAPTLTINFSPLSDYLLFNWSMFHC